MEFTKEKLLKIQSWSETYGPGSNVVLPAEEAEGLARIALAAQAAGPVYQWRERYEDSDLWDDCTKEQYEGFAKRPDVETRILYTAPPASAFEIKDLEHFISFWKKVQEGQMNPGKNDIDHTVWFLEGLSDLTAPPAPVSVPEKITSANAPEVFEIAAEAERLGLRGAYASYAVGWNACRAAMLQGKE